SRSVGQRSEELRRAALGDGEETLLDVSLEVRCRAVGIESGLIGVLLIEKEPAGIGRRAMRQVHPAARLGAGVLGQRSEQLGSLFLMARLDDVGHRGTDHGLSPVLSCLVTQSSP